MFQERLLKEDIGTWINYSEDKDLKLRFGTIPGLHVFTAEWSTHLLPKITVDDCKSVFKSEKVIINCNDEESCIRAHLTF